ncbi:MAG: AAA family ATPase [Rhodanobacter sp.]
MIGAERYVTTLEERAARDLALVERLAPKQSAMEACVTVSNAGNGTDDTNRVTTLRPPVVVDAAGLLSANFPTRERLLEPWLTTQSLTMIYAMRGIGKTHMALGVGYALASAGEFLGWHAPTAVSVLYLDGEMPGVDLQARLSRIIASSPNEAAPGFLRFVTPDMQPDGIMPNLYRTEGQQAIEEVAGDSRVIIVDNLSCLVRGGKENEGESWQPVAEWALRMRASGRSVVFIHHAGKGGQQRGTSKREDLLDTVIALRRPADYVPDQGARFEVHFEKARALYGQDVSPFEAALETLPDGTQAWTTRAATDTQAEQIIEMIDMGLTQGEVAKELGVGRSTVIRRLKRAQEEGLYTPKLKKSHKPPTTSPIDVGNAYRRASDGD